MNSLKESEALLKCYQLIMEHAPDIILFIERDGHIFEANQAAVKAYGYLREELLNMNINDLQNDKNKFLVNKQLEQVNQSGMLFETVHRRKDGSTYPVEISLYGTLINNNRIFLSIIRDITDNKQVDDKLKYYSLHDSLTGLYNRTYFEQEMRCLESGRYDPVGIIMCDVDGLKLVNDTLGHEAGDALLISAAAIIQKCFRKEDVVARIGGDEFAVLLLKSDLDTVKKGYQRIKDAVAGYNATNPKLPLAISVGYDVRSKTLKSVGDIFKEADNTMYQEKLSQGQNARLSIVKAYKKKLTAKDYITEGHTKRLQKIVTKLAGAIGLPMRRISQLRLLAQFHDIGKVGIPDHILFKNGRLTPNETLAMQRHCEIGYRIAQSAPDLIHIADLILKHHEWWNGSGYPLGLAGEEIPLECRIMAIADAYDAMTSDRPYRNTISHDQALFELKNCAGTQFDPQLVGKFLQIINNLRS